MDECGSECGAECGTDYRVSFCDLGISVNANGIDRASAGTLQYADPSLSEPLNHSPYAGCAYDVYALAGTFLYVFTGITPWQHTIGNSAEEATIINHYRTNKSAGKSRFDFAELMSGHKSSICPCAIPLSVFHLFKLMLSFHPTERPSIRQIIDTLESAVDSFATLKFVDLFNSDLPE